MTNQSTTASVKVSFIGSNVPKFCFEFKEKPSILMDVFITYLVKNYAGYAHGIVTGLVYEKANTSFSVFDMINIMSNGVPSLGEHSFNLEDEDSQNFPLDTIMSVINSDDMFDTPIQCVVKDIHESMQLTYKTYQGYYKLPSLYGDLPAATAVANPTTTQPVAIVTAVEIKPTETPAEVKPAVEPVVESAETPAPKPVLEEPAKANTESVSNGMQNVLASNKNLMELITQLQTEVEGILTGGIDYDEPFLAAILKSESGKKLSTLSLRDVVGEALIPKKMETTATLLLKRAGVVTPNELERKAGATALDILKGSPMIFEEIKSRLVKLTKVEVNFDNLEEVFANNNTELSVSEVTALFESIEGITPKVKAEEVDTAETSLGSAMRTAFKKNQAHHAVKKAK